MRRACVLVLLLAVGASSLALARHPRQPARDAAKTSASREAPATGFDYYVMALSWSPSYCRSHPDDDEQCARRGFGFVLHGLWPQYETGNGPQRCASSAEVDRRTAEAALAFMPSRRLINHEWRAHGTCSGLTPAAYFASADRAFASVQAPPQLKAPTRDLTMTAEQLRAALRGANPALTDAMFKLNCSRGELVEVRVCLDRNLAPRECGQRLRNACPSRDTFNIPASR